MKRERCLAKRKTHTLNLTKIELAHLRDLFGILLPPAMDRTISEVLAEAESRMLVESILWKKIEDACVTAGVPVGDECSDFVVAPTGTPPMSVFRVASDLTGDDEQAEVEEVESDEEE
jgi:hypothetical protein